MFKCSNNEWGYLVFTDFGCLIIVESVRLGGLIAALLHFYVVCSTFTLHFVEQTKPSEKRDTMTAVYWTEKIGQIHRLPLPYYLLVFGFSPNSSFVYGTFFLNSCSADSVVFPNIRCLFASFLPWCTVYWSTPYLWSATWFTLLSHLKRITPAFTWKRTDYLVWSRSEWAFRTTVWECTRALLRQTVLPWCECDLKASL